MAFGLTLICRTLNLIRGYLTFWGRPGHRPIPRIPCERHWRRSSATGVKVSYQPEVLQTIFGSQDLQDPNEDLMLLGSSESKHLHVESRFGPKSDHEKRSFMACFLFVFWSYQLPHSHQLGNYSEKQHPGAKSVSRNKRNIDLLPIMSCQRESLFRHSCTPFRLLGLPYRDFFRSTCTPNISQRIFFPFLKRWGQDVVDGHGCFILEKMQPPPPVLVPTYTHAHLHSVLEASPDLSR